MSFSLSLIIFDFFLMTLCLMNRSNQFLITGLIFFILCSSNLSISSLDTIIGILNSFSISFLIFSFLSFNSIPFNSVKSFSNSKDYFLVLKIDYFAYFLSIFSQYFRYYSLGFSSYIFTKLFWNFLKIKILYLSNFWIIPVYFVTEIIPSYICLRKVFEKFMKTKYCISNYFVPQIFPCYIFIIFFWKNSWKQNIVF